MGMPSLRIPGGLVGLALLACSVAGPAASGAGEAAASRTAPAASAIRPTAAARGRSTGFRCATARARWSARPTVRCCRSPRATPAGPTATTWRRSAAAGTSTPPRRVATGGRRGEPWILVDPDDGDPAAAVVSCVARHVPPGTGRSSRRGHSPGSVRRPHAGRHHRATRTNARSAGAMGGVRGTRAELPRLPRRLARLRSRPSTAGRSALENFRWAAAAASGLALVTGAAKEMPNTFDYLMPVVEDALLPTDAGRRLHAGSLPSRRQGGLRHRPAKCPPGAATSATPARMSPHTGQGRWKADEDMHVARGMTCVDCHATAWTTR